MNKLKFLPKLAITGLASAITVTGIVVAPVQALEGDSSTLEWDNGTDDFIDEVTFLPGDFFDVIFSPPALGGEAAVFIADGHFEPFFPDLPGFFPINSGNGALGEFTYLMDSPTPPGAADAAEYQLTNNLEFDFGNGVTATLPSGAVYEGILDVDDSVEFELVTGEWVFELPDNPDTPEFDPKTLTAQSSISEFGQSDGAPGGAYLNEGTHVKVPEPATILGLLTVGGLGFGLKRKKQS